jgi:hypothetical protein
MAFKDLPRSDTKDGGKITGTTSLPFVPILIQQVNSGATQVSFSNNASEYFSPVLSPGCYLVRSFGYHGQFSYTKGVIVRKDTTNRVNFNRLEVLSPDDDMTHVCGFVNSPETMRDCEISVIAQDAVNFRKYLRRDLIDQNGFFELRDLPRQRAYFIFATWEDSLKIPNHQDRHNFTSENSPEKILELSVTLNKISVTGNLRDGHTLHAYVNSTGKTATPLFVLNEIKGNFSLTNVPSGELVFELRQETNVISKGDVDLDQNSTVEIEVDDKIQIRTKAH